MRLLLDEPVPAQLRSRLVEVDQRSRRFTSSSLRISSSGATGGGTGGGPEPANAGGVSTPDRTASARTASARTLLRVSLMGPSSATTRSRSVTRMVSPAAASRTYSLKRLFSTLIPTDLMRGKVATLGHRVNSFPSHPCLSNLTRSALIKIPSTPGNDAWNVHSASCLGFATLCTRWGAAHRQVEGAHHACAHKRLPAVGPMPSGRSA